MHTPIIPETLVSKGCEATEHSGGQTCHAAEDAANLWVLTGGQINLNLAAFNTRSLFSEASLEVLFEELEGINWDVIKLSEVRSTGGGFTVLKMNTSFVTVV